MGEPKANPYYGGSSTGNWIKAVMDHGKLIQLEDGSLWKIAPIDVVTSSIWLPVSDIIIVDGDDWIYPYKLINTDDGELVNAKFIGR